MLKAICFCDITESLFTTKLFNDTIMSLLHATVPSIFYLFYHPWGGIRADFAFVRLKEVINVIPVLCPHVTKEVSWDRTFQVYYCVTVVIVQFSEIIKI